MVSSEISDPQRNLPRSLIFGTLAVIATYLLMNVAYFYVLTPSQVAGTPRLAADMMAICMDVPPLARSLSPFLISTLRR